MADNPVRFVLLSPPRTGSTMLAEMLDSHPAIACFGEVLNPKKPLWLPRAAPAALPAIAPRSDPGGFLDAVVWGGGTEARAVGFKLLEIQLITLGGTLGPYLLGIEDLKVILLDRENVLERYVSSLTARRTGVWRIYDDADRPSPAPVEIEPARLEVFLGKAELQRTAVRRLLHGKDMLELTRETILADPAGQAARLCTFLGVEPGDMQARSRPLATRPLSDRVANFGAVRAYFRGTPHEALFDGT